MRTACTGVLSALAFLFLGSAAIRSGEEPTAQPPYLGLQGISQWSVIGDASFGHSSGLVVFKGGRPLVCFGLSKSPKEKEKYLYLVLLKTPPGDAGRGVAVDQKSSSNGAEATTHETVRVSLGKGTVELSYTATRDRRTHVLKSETIKVGGTEVTPGGPRVFLADLTHEKPALRAVKAVLPEAVPAVTDTDRERSWPATLVRAVDDLKKRSPEVRQFLEAVPK